MDIVRLEIQVNGVGILALIRLFMTSLSRYPIVKIDQVPFQPCACSMLAVLVRTPQSLASILCGLQG